MPFKQTSRFCPIPKDCHQQLPTICPWNFAGQVWRPTADSEDIRKKCHSLAAGEFPQNCAQRNSVSIDAVGLVRAHERFATEPKGVSYREEAPTADRLAKDSTAGVPLSAVPITTLSTLKMIRTNHQVMVPKTISTARK